MVVCGEGHEHLPNNMPFGPFGGFATSIYGINSITRLSVSEKTNRQASVNVTPCMSVMCVNHFMLVYTATCFPATLPLITNCYQICCSACENHWCFWFGRQAVYQSLPHGTYTTIGDSGKVRPAFTIAYQTLPGGRSEYLRRSSAFTNLRLRHRGLDLYAVIMD